jgi:ubiquinone/menaquinone biosynthesis C-methylase UbiE
VLAFYLGSAVEVIRRNTEQAGILEVVQADLHRPPFAPESFDFISCQFAFHHLPDKTRMLREVFAMLRQGGRFVIRNLCPHEHPDWLYYEYFPEAQTIDLQDFWSPDTIV